MFQSRLNNYVWLSNKRMFYILFFFFLFFCESIDWRRVERGNDKRSSCSRAARASSRRALAKNRREKVRYFLGPCAIKVLEGRIDEDSFGMSRDESNVQRTRLFTSLGHFDQFIPPSRINFRLEHSNDFEVSSVPQNTSIRRTLLSFFFFCPLQKNRQSRVYIITILRLLLQ